MSHADAQSPVVGRTKLCMNIAQTVVTGMAAAELELDLARHNVEFVVRHQHFAGQNLEKPGQCRD